MLDLLIVVAAQAAIRQEGATPLPTLLELIHKDEGTADIPSVVELQSRFVYPTFFGSDIVGEYTLLRERLGFSTQEIVRIARTGFEAAFLPPEPKTSLLRDFDTWLSAHEPTGRATRSPI